MLSGSGEEATENGEDLEDDSSEMVPHEFEIFMKDKRRAKSLPAYPEQATLFDEFGNGRKRVKFADTMGLNLESVKHFSTAEVPKIPSKVLARLQSLPPSQGRGYLEDLCANFKSTLTMSRLVPTFKMPVETGDFEARVRQLHVALERVTITQFDVRGQIRADTQNCPETRDVGVRYTHNDWLSSADAQAMAMPGNAATSVVGESFAFTLYTHPFLNPSSSVHFAVYMRNEQEEFWDNNNGLNYTLK